MSNAKFVIVERTWRGHFRALPKLAFETEQAAKDYITETYRPLYQQQLHVEQRELKADDTNDRMTCQCCGRKILAKKGLVANHGYQRPGTGWQTSSCAGAQALPFEVSRDTLGWLIDSVRARLRTMVQNRADVAAETAPVTFTYVEHGKDGKRQNKVLSLTRDSFKATIDASGYRMGYYGDDAQFNAFKARDLRQRDREIERTGEWIAEMQARFDGWQQTHKRDGELWVRL
jgi:hypothetical protein